MNDLRAIAGSYERIEGFLKDLHERQDAAGEADERDCVAREQEINDQAYFVLAWGQLETEIDEACRDAIRRGQSHDDWRASRALSPASSQAIDTTCLYDSSIAKQPPRAHAVGSPPKGTD